MRSGNPAENLARELKNKIIKEILKKNNGQYCEEQIGGRLFKLARAYEKDEDFATAAVLYQEASDAISNHSSETLKKLLSSSLRPASLADLGLDDPALLNVVTKPEASRDFPIMRTIKEPTRRLPWVNLCNPLWRPEVSYKKDTLKLLQQIIYAKEFWNTRGFVFPDTFNNIAIVLKNNKMNTNHKLGLIRQLLKSSSSNDGIVWRLNEAFNFTHTHSDLFRESNEYYATQKIRNEIYDWLQPNPDLTEKLAYLHTIVNVDNFWQGKQDGGGLNCIREIFACMIKANDQFTLAAYHALSAREQWKRIQTIAKNSLKQEKNHQFYQAPKLDPQARKLYEAICRSAFATDDELMELAESARKAIPVVKLISSEEQTFREDKSSIFQL